MADAETRRYSFGKGSRTRDPFRRRRLLVDPRQFIANCERCWGTGATWPRYPGDKGIPDWLGEPTGACEACRGTGRSDFKP
jgi:hypothetical protein